MPDIHALDVTKMVEREGWDCVQCGHRHAGRTLANICIGCPCPATAPTPRVYAGSALCGAVNALLDAVDTPNELQLFISGRAERLRVAHNAALFEEAQSAELPDSRHEPNAGGK